jgi:hypothetical protein
MAFSLAPALLLSMPQLLDQNFCHTVILLCQHSELGAFGLVVNRPLLTTGRDFEFWVGGPVEPERSWILAGGHDYDDLPGMRIADDLLLSTSRSAAASARAQSTGDREADRRLCRVGPRSARSGAQCVGVAHRRDRSRPDFQHASGSYVGNGHQTSRCRSRRAANVTRRSLNRQPLPRGYGSRRRSLFC